MITEFYQRISIRPEQTWLATDHPQTFVNTLGAYRNPEALSL